MAETKCRDFCFVRTEVYNFLSHNNFETNQAAVLLKSIQKIGVPVIHENAILEACLILYPLCIFLLLKPIHNFGNKMFLQWTL